MSESDRSTEAVRVPTLAELIAEKRGNFSYRELEVRSGGVITHQRWQQLGTGSRVKEFSEPTTLKAMARALDVDEVLIVLAMAKSIGINVESGAGGRSILAQMLPRSTHRLTVAQRNAVANLVRAITEPEPFESVDRLLDHLTSDELTAALDKGRRRLEKISALDREAAERARKEGVSLAEAGNRIATEALEKLAQGGGPQGVVGTHPYREPAQQSALPPGSPDDGKPRPANPGLRGHREALRRKVEDVNDSAEEGL